MFPSSCQVFFLVISPGFFVRFAIAFVVWYDSLYKTGRRPENFKFGI